MNQARVMFYIHEPNPWRDENECERLYEIDRSAWNNYLKSSKLRCNLVMFIFISLKFRVSKSSSCELVIFNQMLSLLLNLFCKESKTWLNDASPAHVTWMVLLNDSWGAHEHGEISGRMEQWSEATCTIETSVYTNDPISTALFSVISFFFLFLFFCYSLVP